MVLSISTVEVTGGNFSMAANSILNVDQNFKLKESESIYL